MEYEITTQIQALKTAIEQLDGPARDTALEQAFRALLELPRAEVVLTDMMMKPLRQMAADWGK